MDEEQAKRVVLNAERFMHDLIPCNQRGSYNWLKYEKHFDIPYKSYEWVAGYLFEKYEIKKILKETLIFLVLKRFPPTVLSRLKGWWYRGGLPEYSDVKELTNEVEEAWLETIRKGKFDAVSLTKLKEDQKVSFLWRPFLEIDAWAKDAYVERWNSLGFVWFEVLKPWIEEGME